MSARFTTGAARGMIARAAPAVPPALDLTDSAQASAAVAARFDVLGAAAPPLRVQFDTVARPAFGQRELGTWLSTDHTG